MAPAPPPPAAIVIAGGRSTRFGSDKLAAEIGGRALLARTLDAVRTCTPVALVSGAEAPLTRGLVTVSEYPRWGGPAAAIAAGVAALPEHAAETLIVAADLANPETAVAALLGVATGVLADGEGRAQWLLARAPTAALRARIARLEAEGGTTGRPARAILGELGLALVAAPGDAVADIDLQQDLDRMKEQR